MNIKSLVLIAAASTLAFAPLANATSHAKKPAKQHVETGRKERLGTLDCQVAGGIGLLIGSSKTVECNFVRRSGPVEKYRGSIGKLGLDIGITEKSYIRWVVYNLKASRAGERALAGTYVGASATAAVGIGLGANVLVSGGEKNFGLQPLSAEASTGLNVAAGVTRLELKAVR